MKLIVLSYNDAKAYVHEVPAELIDAQIEQLEEYLTETLNYNLDNINWMITTQEDYLEEVTK